jgi:hypothetical protein
VGTRRAATGTTSRSLTDAVASGRSPVDLGWQLRIELLEVTPTIWRRLLIPSDIRLPKLHRVLQTVLGWTNSHLHEFVISGKRYAIYDPEFSSELKQRDERRVVLEKALEPETRCFDYIYDFGDSWHHIVIVEHLYARLDAHNPFSCVAGENACPPEDVGGPHGYGEFLEVLADPTHEEHEHYTTWSGGNFDPKRFDRDAVNAALEKINP